MRIYIKMFGPITKIRWIKLTKYRASLLHITVSQSFDLLMCSTRASIFTTATVWSSATLPVCTTCFHLRHHILSQHNCTNRYTTPKITQCKGGRGEAVTVEHQIHDLFQELHIYLIMTHFHPVRRVENTACRPDAYVLASTGVCQYTLIQCQWFQSPAVYRGPKKNWSIK
jgi:hypothetical protein